MGKWAENATELERLVRLKTFPLAFKRLKTAEELAKIPHVRRMDFTCPFCQLETLARTAGWTIGATKKELPTGCGSLFGLVECPREERIKRRVKRWVSSREDGEKAIDALTLIPTDDYEAVLVGPLAADRFEPDVISVFGTPAQMVMLMCAIQHERYHRFDCSFVGESSCADGVPKCYLSHESVVTIPCYGERRNGHVAEDELRMAMTPDDLEKALKGMKALSKQGIRYPITPAGTLVDLAGAAQKAIPEGRLTA